MQTTGDDPANSSPGLEYIRKTHGKTSLEYVNRLTSKIEHLEKRETEVQTELEREQQVWKSLLENEAKERSRVDCATEENKAAIERLNDEICSVEREHDCMLFRHKGESEKIWRKQQLTESANQEIGKRISQTKASICKKAEEYKRTIARSREILQKEKGKMYAGMRVDSAV